MTSATAVFILNIGAAALFAASFLVLGLAHRSQQGTAGFGVSYLVGMLTPLSEFLLPMSAHPQVFQFTSYAGFLVGLLIMPLALGRFFGQRPMFGVALAIAAIGLMGRIALWDGPRNTMPYELLYQLPFAAATALSCHVAARHGTRTLHRWLAFAFGLVSLHFLLKPFIAMAVGSGPTAQTYAGSIYAPISQAFSGLLLIATGLVLLLIVFQQAILHSQEVSETDLLSGLLNRRGFDRVAAAALARAGQSGVPVTVISFDIDHFKRINDGHGHDVGDAVIAHFAELLRRAAPAGAAVARMGGEEFTVLLERTTRDVARLQAETVRSVLNAGSDGLPGYTVSAGIAQWQGGERLRDLLRNADQALYTAKGAGRNRVHMFLPTTAAPSDTRLAASG